MNIRSLLLHTKWQYEGVIQIMLNQNVFDYIETRTREPGPVLGNLDLNRSLVWNPYSGTWTRTWEPVLVYVLKSWPNMGDSYGRVNFKKKH